MKPLQPLNDLAMISPVDPAALEISKSDGFGMKASKDVAPEEALRWRVVAAGPGNYSSAGMLIPNPLHVGDVLILANATNRGLRDSWAKVTELIDGQKFLLCRGFSGESMIIVVDRHSQ